MPTARRGQVNCLLKRRPALRSGGRKFSQTLIRLEIRRFSGANNRGEDAGSDSENPKGFEGSIREYSAKIVDFDGIQGSLLRFRFWPKKGLTKRGDTGIIHNCRRESDTKNHSKRRQTNLENDTEKRRVKLRCEDAAGRLRSAEAERAGSERVLREKQSEF